jgi:hypothetical protein
VLRPHQKAVLILAGAAATSHLPQKHGPHLLPLSLLVLMLMPPCFLLSCCWFACLLGTSWGTLLLRLRLLLLLLGWGLPGLKLLIHAPPHRLYRPG